MRSEILVLLALGAVTSLGTAAAAQGRAVLDCRAPGTVVEATICASPRLVQLQNLAAEEFRFMAERIGRPEARQVARAELALLSTCGADRACIEDSLLAAVAVFRATAPDTALEGSPRLAPDQDFETVPDFGADPGLGVTSPPPLADWPVGLDGVLILPAVPEAPSGWLGDLSPEDRLLLGAPQAVPGAGPLLRPPPPLEAAFRDLPEERRRNVQARLALAGFGGVPDGLWGPVTEDALTALALEAITHGLSFDSSTQDGAAALMAYVESADFAADLLVNR
jgi:uncharacterized protein